MAAVRGPVRRRMRLVTTLLALPAALLACELAVRYDLVGPAPRPRLECKLFGPMRLPELGLEHAPHGVRTTYLRTGRCSPERAVVQSLNGQRLRGAEVAVPKPAGTLRIACVGDSHTFGDGVEEGHTWPALLEAELRRRHPDRRIEVLNCGVNNYDTPREALWIEHHVLSLEPDWIVLGYFVNDVGDRTVGLTSEVHHFVTRLCHPRRGGAMAWVRSRSALVDAVAETAFRWRHLPDYGVALAERYRDGDAGWRVTRDVLARLQQELAARGVGFGVALYPMMAAGPGLAKGEPGLVSTVPYAVVGAFLERSRILYLNPEAPFLGRDLVSLRIAPGDVHAGAEAHGIFASEVADWMDRDWFPALPVEPAAEPRSDGSAAPGPG